MRNLTPTGVKLASLDDLCPSGHAARVAIDTESGELYVAVERRLDGGGIEVDMIRITIDGSIDPKTEVSLSGSIMGNVSKRND